MCIEIFYTFFGLYASYCCCFCSSMAYTLYKERQQQRYNIFTGEEEEEEDVFTEFS